MIFVKLHKFQSLYCSDYSLGNTDCLGLDLEVGWRASKLWTNDLMGNCMSTHPMSPSPCKKSGFIFKVFLRDNDRWLVWFLFLYIKIHYHSSHPWFDQSLSPPSCPVSRHGFPVRCTAQPSCSIFVISSSYESGSQSGLVGLFQGERMQCIKYVLVLITVGYLSWVCCHMFVYIGSNRKLDNPATSWYKTFITSTILLSLCHPRESCTEESQFDTSLLRSTKGPWKVLWHEEMEG